MKDLKKRQNFSPAATLAISEIASLECSRSMSVHGSVTSQFALRLENSVQERQKQKQTNRSVRASYITQTFSRLISRPFLVTTSSNISNHSCLRTSRTPEPPTTTVNTASFRILSSSFNSPCHIWHALQPIPHVSTSNL